MQDRPDARELLEFVCGFLREEVADAVPRELRFKVLVAASICGIVEREIRWADEEEDVRLFRELLERVDVPLGDQPLAGRELAERLVSSVRAGAFDGSLEDFITRLQPHVQRKVRISTPGYDA
jgi:hypothetical protein